MSNNLFGEDLTVVNVGLASFEADAAAQGARTAQVNWSPPREYSPEVTAAMAKLRAPDVAARIAAANREVVQRVIDAHPVLTGFAPAIDVVPG